MIMTLHFILKASLMHVKFILLPMPQSYDYIFIGSTQIFGLPELVHYFGDYETLSLSVKSNKLSVYLNGILGKVLILFHTTALIK